MIESLHKIWQKPKPSHTIISRLPCPLFSFLLHTDLLIHNTQARNDKCALAFPLALPLLCFALEENTLMAGFEWKNLHEHEHIWDVWMDGSMHERLS